MSATENTFSSSSLLHFHRKTFACPFFSFVSNKKWMTAGNGLQVHSKEFWDCCLLGLRSNQRIFLGNIILSSPFGETFVGYCFSVLVILSFLSSFSPSAVPVLKSKSKNIDAVISDFYEIQYPSSNSSFPLHSFTSQALLFIVFMCYLVNHCTQEVVFWSYVDLYISMYTYVLHITKPLSESYCLAWEKKLHLHYNTIRNSKSHYKISSQQKVSMTINTYVNLYYKMFCKPDNEKRVLKLWGLSY